MKNILKPYLASFPHSRVHLLKYILPKNGISFVKRDDELGFAISGSKLRKYHSLLPIMLKNDIEHAVMIGGAYSNNLLGLSQLLIENNITPHLMVRGEKASKPVGNLLLLSTLVPPNQIKFIARKDWLQVDDIAKDYSKSFNQSMVIPEGADMVESLPGALTLAFDILENEKQLNLSFDHIFIEAGTGFTAIALILGLARVNNLRNIHILLLADTKEIFIKKLCFYYENSTNLFNTPLQFEKIISSIQFYMPGTAKSFGATNATIFECITDIARSDGFFTDPIYSAKLFCNAKNVVEKNNLQGNVLVVHSGGGLALMGYQENLLRAINSI